MRKWFREGPTWPRSDTGIHLIFYETGLGSQILLCFPSSWSHSWKLPSYSPSQTWLVPQSTIMIDMGSDEACEGKEGKWVGWAVIAWKWLLWTIFSVHNISGTSYKQRHWFLFVLGTIFSSMPAYVTALKDTGSSYTAKGKVCLLSSTIKCLMLEQRAGMLTAHDKASGFALGFVFYNTTHWSSGPWHIIFWEMGL